MNALAHIEISILGKVYPDITLWLGQLKISEKKNSRRVALMLFWRLCFPDEIRALGERCWNTGRMLKHGHLPRITP